MSERKKKLIRISLLLLIAATLVFIFVNSLIPTDISSEESEAVSGWLENIFPTSTALGAFIARNVRKIAHFVEFGALGAELTAYALLFTDGKRKGLSLSTLSAFFAAFFDETLQIFSGRGAMISDVWLDFLGAMCASFVCILIYLIILKISEKRKKGDTSG